MFFFLFFRELLILAIRKLSSEFYCHHHALFIPHEMPVSHFELVSLSFSLLTFWGFIEVSVVAYNGLEDATPRHLCSESDHAVHMKTMISQYLLIS